MSYLQTICKYDNGRVAFCLSCHMTFPRHISTPIWLGTVKISVKRRHMFSHASDTLAFAIQVCWSPEIFTIAIPPSITNSPNHRRVWAILYLLRTTQIHDMFMPIFHAYTTCFTYLLFRFISDYSIIALGRITPFLAFSALSELYRLTFRCCSVSVPC